MLIKIGETLKSARESKKLSLKDVSKDTNIIVKYLEALENENFDIFPSETYLLGFLRSYAEYLKLDADGLVQAYKGYKIGESSTPIEELTKPTQPMIFSNLKMLFDQYKKYFYMGLVGIVFILFIMLIGNLMFNQISIDNGSSIKSIQQEYYRVQGKKLSIKNIWPLKLSNDSGIVLLYKNEACQFLVSEKELLFMLSDIDNSGIWVEFLPESKRYYLEMEKPNIIQFDNVKREIVLTLKGLTDNRAKIKVELGGMLAKEDILKNNEEKQPVSSEVVTQNQQNLKIMLDAVFEKKTYFELYVDGNEKVRGIIPAGTREHWEANEFVQMKIGNAGGVKFRINNKEYIFGAPGEVVNKIITWKKDVNNPNKYHIHIKDW